ncbi:hypothetical protein P43SY_006022 [Pythium insidiosum]|uniref:Ubiquitin-like protease family profile domain-containing protein n=1 Tax=Pythium insidiosum TaxID=114742 RepID=A0AAD5M159_PYTIN|nr:hypothetical protein P43SY_006022 [Pythium insidiosum]
MAGRAVTYLAEKSFDSDFLVESVFSAGVDYTLHFVQLNIGSLAGGAADAQLLADVVAASGPDAVSQPVLWEGRTTSGRFDVVPGGIRGTVLRENEVVLTLSQGATQYRLPFSLFCDGQAKLIRLAQPELELRYACAQTRRAASPSRIAKAGFPIVSPGLPAKRLERAICSQDGPRRYCKARGGLAISEHRAADGGVATTKPVLRFGASVPDVTLFTDNGFRGTFAICRACSPAELEALTQKLPFTAAILGIPDPPADMLQVECAEPTTGGNGSTMQLRRDIYASLQQEQRDVPKQTDGDDCGMYVIEFIKRYATELKFDRADGKKLPILFIIKGKSGGPIERDELPSYPASHHYVVQESAWMDASVWTYYAKELLSYQIEDPSVLLLDNFDSDGKKLSILFIIKGKSDGPIERDELPSYPASHHYVVQESAWMDASVWTYYVKELLSYQIEDPSVLLLDNFDSHSSEQH